MPRTNICTKLYNFFTSFISTRTSQNDNNDDKNNTSQVELTINDKSLEKNNDNKSENQIENKTDDSDNKKQALSSIFSSAIESTKILMACLLSIFVPQYCEDTQATCTLSQNFSNLTPFNEFVIFTNFLTLGVFIYLIYIQNKREIYFINHLDNSKDYSYNSLEQNIIKYPKILNRVKQYNKKIQNITYTTIILFSFNLLFSCILIFYYFYDGFRSVSTMLSNVLLVTNKLYTLYTICRECNSYKPLALSTINHNYVSYNIVDEEYDTLHLFHNKDKIIIKSNKLYSRYSKQKLNLIKNSLTKRHPNKRFLLIDNLKTNPSKRLITKKLNSNTKQ
jgi:hypothetical protein